MHGRMMSPVVTVLQRHVEEPPAKISKLKPGPQYPNFQLMPSHTILPSISSRMAVVMAAAWTESVHVTVTPLADAVMEVSAPVRLARHVLYEVHWDPVLGIVPDVISDVQDGPGMGATGALVGAGVGSLVGAGVGSLVGAGVGSLVGAAVGSRVGAAVGPSSSGT